MPESLSFLGINLDMYKTLNESSAKRILVTIYIGKSYV